MNNNTNEVQNTVSTDFTTRRQAELAAQQAAQPKAEHGAQEAGALLYSQPGPGEPPEVLAIATRRLPRTTGGGWQGQLEAAAQEKTFGVLLDGALAMASSRYRVQGEPAGRVLPAPGPVSTEPPQGRTGPVKGKPGKG